MGERVVKGLSSQKSGVGEGQATQFIQHKYNEGVDRNGYVHIHVFFEDRPRAHDGGCGNFPVEKLNGFSACGWPQAELMTLRTIF